MAEVLHQVNGVPDVIRHQFLALDLKHREDAEEKGYEEGEWFGGMPRPMVGQRVRGVSID
ncbi:MAG: hypothetical protein ACRCYP_03670 [Alphaproteobacteria bacterium]